MAEVYYDFFLLALETFAVNFGSGMIALLLPNNAAVVVKNIQWMKAVQPANQLINPVLNRYDPAVLKSRDDLACCEHVFKFTVNSEEWYPIYDKYFRPYFIQRWEATRNEYSIDAEWNLRGETKTLPGNIKFIILLACTIAFYQNQLVANHKFSDFPISLSVR